MARFSNRAFFYAFLVGIIIFSGCKSNSESYSLDEQEPLDIQLENAPFENPIWAGLLLREGNPWIGFSFLETPALFFTSLEQPNQKVTIQLDTTLKYPLSVCAKDDTSFFFFVQDFQNPYRQIYLANWDGEFLDTINTEGQYQVTWLSDTVPEFEGEVIDAGPYTPLQYREERLYMGMLPFLAPFERNGKSGIISVAWDLKDADLVRFPVSHPKMYMDRKTSIDYIGSFQAVTDSFLVLGFPGSGHMIKHNLQNGKTNNITVESELLSLKSPPLFPEDMKKEKLLLKNGWWGPVFWEKERNFYYRICFKQMAESENPSDSERIPVLICLDHKLNKLVEKELPVGLNPRAVFIQGQMLYINYPSESSTTLFRVFYLKRSVKT